MKLKGVIIFLILIGGIAGYLYLKSNDTKSTQANKQAASSENTTTLKDLIVSPQSPTDKVMVESATFQTDGFIVVRQMEEGKLGQIVEMSKPLEKGTNKNIPVNLAGVDPSGMELAVMLYEDFESDKTFNDLDMPSIDKNGYMIGRYVKTGKPLPSSITEGESPNMMMNMPGMKSMTKVRYTDKGFVPERTEIEQGSMVQFINESSKPMWVASMPHPAHTDLSTFDQFRPLKKGAIYRYVFDKKGAWEFHDHISPSLGGVVVVK